MNEQGLTRQKVFSELVKSPHGKLEEYLEVGRTASKEDPEFFAHVVAWNAKKGQIRDSRVALPLIALDGLVPVGDAELTSNALAHLALLPARDLLRGVRFAKTAKLSGRRHRLPKLVGLYLHTLEQNPGRWTRVAVQHRRTLHELYSLCSVKPISNLPYSVLFNEDENGEKLPQPGGIFGTIANLRTMSEMEAASAITTKHLPFLIAAPGVGGEKLNNKDVMVALIGSMTPSEITSHQKMMEKRGIKKDPALRGALDKALGRVQSSDSSALKLTKAIESVEDDDTRERLKQVQEKKLDKSSVEGNWLVLVDRSSSMRASIELGKLVGATLARMTKGNVWLVFFATDPAHYDVSGKTLEQVTEMTRLIQAGGNTSVGVGVRWANERKLDIDGIALVTDGGENTAPMFTDAYKELCKRLDREIPVYHYYVPGDQNVLAVNCQRFGVEMHRFDVPANMDYYSLPNLIGTMRTNRYSLVDEIMEFPLLKLENVLKVKELVSV